jgi:ribosomal-protein-serine acetyltransferase
MFVHHLDEEVALFLLEPYHAEELFRLTEENRDYLREWLPWVDHTRSVEDTRSFIELTMKEFAEQQGLTAGIRFKGNLCGVIGFHNADWSNRHISIGYWLGQSFQGHGIMTRACSAFVQHAFVRYGMNRIEIRAGVGNAKSRAIPERLGFVFEGIARQAMWLHDRYIDLAVYSKLVKDWIEPDVSAGG